MRSQAKKTSHWKIRRSLLEVSANLGFGIFFVDRGANLKIWPRTACRYKGTNYIEGDVIEIEEPCLSCLCKKGSLICNLRICPDLPESPPPGCVIVHKQNRCCPQLLCGKLLNILKYLPKLNKNESIAVLAPELFYWVYLPLKVHEWENKF